MKKLKLILLGVLAFFAPSAFAFDQPSTPNQVALYSAAGATIVVEVRNAAGVLVPLVDTAGVTYSNQTVTLASSTAVGLGWALSQVKPDATHSIVVPGASAWTLIIRVTSGVVTESPVGTPDGSAGAGSGIAIKAPAPNATTPTSFVPGPLYVISPGNVITTIGGATTVLGVGAGVTLPTTLPPQSTGGLSVYSALSQLATTGNNIKSSAGQVYGWFLSNTGTTTRYIKLYAKATAPTSADTPFIRISLPAGGAANVSFPNGIAFALGIGIRATAGQADNDNTDPSANDVTVNVFYG